MHSMAGVSRSASTVIAYLILKFKWTLQKTLAYVKYKRPIVNPNFGFMK